MLRVLILVIFFALVSPSLAAADPLPPPPYSTLTYREAESLVRRFDAISDQLPEDSYPMIRNQREMDLWIKEIVPYFGYEGITGPDWAEQGGIGYKYPRKATFDYFDTRGSQGQHHIMGMANCLSGEMWLNARFTNPVSPLYERRTTLGTLVHELAHIQGICYRADSEQSAQLVTLEILAAMSLKGDRYAFATLIDELRGMSLSATLYLALRDDRMDDYQQLVRDVANGPFALAANAKSMRYWSEEPDELERILRLYSFEPVQRLTVALDQGICNFTNPTWDAEANDIAYPLHSYDVPCVTGVQLPVNQMVFRLPLIIDDLAYVFEHAEELAEAIN